MDRRDFMQESLFGLAYLSALRSPTHPIITDNQVAIKTESVNLRDLWQVGFANAFHQGLLNGCGFSFILNEKKVGPGLFDGWEVSTEQSGETINTAFRSSGGLLVTREVRPFPQFSSVEYTVRFKNEGLAELPPLSSVLALNLSFADPLTRGISVLSCGGGMSTGAYPPDQFALRRHYMGPSVTAFGEVTLTTEGGRSSNLDLPFFFVEHEPSGTGLFIAFGWSGQWMARVSINLPDRRLDISGSMPRISLQLQPGEEISGPRILLGCYEGSLSQGSNLLRRLIREQYSPMFKGKKPQPVATYDHWWDIGATVNEGFLRGLADAAADIGQEYFLLDTGWYEGVTDQWTFSTGLGNWEADKTKFPSGLRALSEYTRSKGMKFGLWFEPERVAKNSRLAKEHPDWILWLPEEQSHGDFFTDPEYGLLDFGRQAVQEWVTSMIVRHVEENGVEYLRYDFNLDPLGYWDSHDVLNRRGLLQIRHIEGLYRVIDSIRNRCPITLMEGCASGGRRIDLEMARRFHTFWISDYTIDPNLIRFHIEGLSHFLPGNYMYVCYWLPVSAGTNPPPDDISFQSLFGGAFGTAGRIDLWSQEMKTRARRHVEVYKRLRQYLVEDYYLLSSQPRDLDSWEAWQFHSAKTNEGFVQAFRMRSQKHTTQFPLRGVKPDFTYILQDVYTGKSMRVAGSTLLKNGVAFELARMSSQVWTYRPA
jgi:alpha-galactosidase